MADTPEPPVLDPLPDRLAAPIAPARVIDIGPASSRATRAVNASCPRCRGAYDPGARFCRFCGLSLARVAPASRELADSNATRPAPPSEVAPGPPPSAAAPSHDPRADRAPPSSPRARPAFEPVTTRNLGAPMSVARSVTGATEVAGPAIDDEVETLFAASPVVARVVLIRRDGSEGSTHTLGAGAVTDVGRLEGQILFPDDSYVSPRHARIVARGGAFFVLDLESVNGVFVRVPFAGHGPSGGEDDERGPRPPDRTTVRGHHSHTVSGGSDGLASGLSDQPLADQDLFLVGQQVLRFEVVRQAEEAFGAASENGTLLFGTPATPRFARLSQRTVEGVVRDVFHLRKADTVIGRESGDIVFTDDPFLSRRHAVVRMQGGEGQPRRFTIADLGSSNGTFLRIRDEVRLRHGDHFRIGQQLLRFDIDASRAGI